MVTRGQPPRHIAPMLARTGPLPADPAGWSFEIKWDGVRVIGHVGEAGVRLQSRTQRDVSATYPELVAPPPALAGRSGTVLDGEVISTDAEGRPSFGTLQRRMNVSAPSDALCAAVPVTYVVFDLLWLDGEEVTGLPYVERRTRLEALDITGRSWSVPEAHPGQGAGLLEATRRRGLEGIVAKRLDSPYRPGVRSDAWRKLKHSRREELLIGGWLPGAGRRSERIGALLMGHIDEVGRLRFDGRVGTGFSDAGLAELARVLGPLRRTGSPFDPAPRLPANAVYVEPEAVAEVEYVERTAQGLMRAPSFKGLRGGRGSRALAPGGSSATTPEGSSATTPEPSRSAGSGAARSDDEVGTPGERDGEVRFAGRTLRITNHAKVLYPETGFTKGELIGYHAAVASTVLPHLRGRALTLKRYPDGVAGDHFYEKTSPAHRPGWVSTARVGDVDYTVVEEAATLVWLGNLADLELHTSLALAVAPEVPTLVAFDLDPGPPAGLLECAQVALLIRGIFEQYGMVAAVKTSGNKGLQVYVPLNDPEITYAQTKSLARRIAELLAQRLPELVLANMARAKRPGRVFVDWSQNDVHKTTVTVYSLRATAQPSVSTPLAWDEVAAALEARDVAALRFGPDQVVARIDAHGDLFAPVLDLCQTLPPLR